MKSLFLPTLIAQVGICFSLLTDSVFIRHLISWCDVDTGCQISTVNPFILPDTCTLVYYTITALERDQYEVLWSRVQQYWIRRSQVQYCCTLLHKTSYWSSSSVVIVLLHKALFYYNFVLFENFIILNFFWKFWNLLKFLSFEILWKFWFLWNFLTLISKKQFLCNKKPYCTLVRRNFIHWFCTRVQYAFLLNRNCFLLINMLENGMSRVLLFGANHFFCSLDKWACKKVAVKIHN